MAGGFHWDNLCLASFCVGAIIGTHQEIQYLLYAGFFSDCFTTNSSKWLFGKASSLLLTEREEEASCLVFLTDEEKKSSSFYNNEKDINFFLI